MSAAFSKSNSSSSGPSKEIIKRLFKILLLSLFRSLVFILLRAEKPLSQSALDIGMTSAITVNLYKLGNMCCKDGC